MNYPLVATDLLAIPDGVSKEGVRLGITVTPSRKVKGSIALDKWPETIAEWGQRMRVRIADIVNGVVDTSSEDRILVESQMTAFLSGSHRGNPNLTRAEAAGKLWVELFDPPGIGMTGFAGLYSAIKEDPDPSPDAGPDGLRGVATARTGDLRLLFRQMMDTFAKDATTQSKKHAPLRAELSRMLYSMTSGTSTKQLQFREEAVGRLRSVLAERIARTRYPTSNSVDPYAERAAELKLLTSYVVKLLEPSASKTVTPSEQQAFEQFVAEMAIMLGIWSSEDSDLRAPPAEDFNETPAEIAGRKLFALKEIPTLCHYFGLAIQVEIPRTAFAGREGGAIAVEFVDESENARQTAEPAWTAFKLPAAELEQFLPASSLEGDRAYIGGYLDLGFTKDGRPRYTLDTIATVNSLLEMLAAGPDRDHLQRRSGFVLIDHCTRSKLEMEIADSRREVIDRTVDAATLLYEHHLVHGYRPDFAIANKADSTLDSDAKRWSTITARTIRAEHGLLDPEFYSHPLIASIAHRDHGLTMVPNELRRVPLLGGAVACLEEELFHWGGESLGVSRGMREGKVVDPAKDLGLTLHYNVEIDGSAGSALPPLREGVGYICGCRLVYQNGGGPDLERARQWYVAHSNALIGQKGKKPFVFPPDIVAAPDAHLKWDDPLIDAATDASRVLRETSSLLAIRDEKGSRLRIVTPPRIAQDAAEIQCQFDDVQSDIPPGSLEGVDGLWRFGPDGALPEARFRQIRWLETLQPPHPTIDSPTAEVIQFVHVPLDGWEKPPIKMGTDEYDSSPYRQSRGTVAIIGRRRMKSPQPPYYVDRNSRQLKAVLSPSSIPVAMALVETIREFWRSDARPNDAKPIVIELVPSRSSDAIFSSVKTIDLVNIDGSTTRLPLIRVELGPAEIYDLTLSAAVCNGLSDGNALKLVHAVKQPLDAPVLAKAVDTAIGIAAVSVTVRTEDAAGAGDLPSWAEVVAANIGSGLDMLEWPSLENGATTYFVGRVEAHRKSTGKLRCEAEWIEFDPQTVTLTPTGLWVRNFAQRSEIMFQFDVERESAANHVDLLFNQETGGSKKLRGLSYTFTNGRARRLRLKLVATSSFTRFYPDEGQVQPGPDSIGAYEKQSSDFEDAPAIWTKCTFRPPPPKVDRILPVFDWGKLPGKRESATRTTVLRIHLDEGWYESGEGEQLGIVLLRSEHTSGGVCSYDEDPLKPFRRFLTRAGADAIWTSSEESIHLEPANFIEGVEPPIDDAELFLATEQGTTPRSVLGKRATNATPLPVRVLPMTPKFTAEEGLHCDLKVDFGGSYTPFLHLGLVRFQPNAVAHLRVSHPIEQVVQILPDRTLWVERVQGEAKRRVFHIGGAGYSTGPGKARTVVDLHVLRWLGDKSGFGEPTTPILGNTTHFDVATGRMHCSVQFRLPAGYQEKRFALLVEEFEIFPAEQPTGNFDGGRATFREIEQRRLVFSHLMHLGVA